MNHLVHLTFDLSKFSERNDFIVSKTEISMRNVYNLLNNIQRHIDHMTKVWCIFIKRHINAILYDIYIFFNSIFIPFLPIN